MSKSKQLSLLDKREYPKGEGVWMNKQAKVSNSYVGSIGLYKRIVNADTRSIRIANADGQCVAS